MDVAFCDVDLVDRLAFAQRNVAVRAGERAVEREGDALVDHECAVALDLYDDVGVGEDVALRLRGGNCDERDGEHSRRQNCTRGASRACSSISKYGFGSNENISATRLVGIVWRAFSYERTVSL